MKIRHSSLTLRNGSAFLRFSINPNDLREIKRRKLFNFIDDLFETTPPVSFEEGELIISGAEEHAAGHVPDEPFELDPALWQVMEMRADNKMYPTFFQLRLDGKYTGTLTDAMMDFAVRKTTGKENLSEKSTGIVKSLVSDLVEKIQGDSGKIDDSGADVVTNIIRTMENQGVSFDPMVTIEKYLKEKGIPYLKEERAFYFSVNIHDLHWNVETGIADDDLHILIFSSCSVKTSEETTQVIVDTLHELNNTSGQIQFEFDTSSNTLFVQSEFTINLVELDNDFDKSLNSNFQSTEAILKTLSQKFGDQVTFFI